MTRVENVTNKDGKAIPNQFIIQDDSSTIFQSYNSIIAVKRYGAKTILDSTYWDYSRTTGKYLNQFLGETKKETLKKIKDGTYILKNLNA